MDSDCLKPRNFLNNGTNLSAIILRLRRGNRKSYEQSMGGGMWSLRIVWQLLTISADRPPGIRILWRGLARFWRLGQGKWCDLITRRLGKKCADPQTSWPDEASGQNILTYWDWFLLLDFRRLRYLKLSAIKILELKIPYYNCYIN